MRFKALSSNVWLILNHPCKKKYHFFLAETRLGSEGIARDASRCLRCARLTTGLKGLHMNSGELASFSRQGREDFCGAIRVSIPRDRRHGASSSSSGPNQSFQTTSENSGDTKRGFWADPPRLSPRPKLVRNLVSNWCQRPPIWPVLPTQPTRNHLSVNNLRFQAFHGMEEVIGSIPIRSTNCLNNLKRFGIWCSRS